MRRFTVTCWVLLIDAGATGRAAGHNLIVNGGFERPDADDPGKPAGFESGQVGKHPAAMTWESPGRTGDRCVAVRTENTSGLGYWQTVVPVEPRTEYTLRLHYRTGVDAKRSGDPLYNQGRPGGPNIELGAPGERGKATAWSDMGTALHPVGGIFLPPARDWANFRHTFTTGPAQPILVVKLRLWCYARKVWFDDISLTPGPDEAPPGKAGPPWLAQDTTPPRVFAPRPRPNTANGTVPAIGAALVDEGTGIDPETVRVTLDGRDVSARAILNPGRIDLKPAEPLPPGPHRVSVAVTDRAGNPGNRLVWQFGVGRALRNVLAVTQDSSTLNGEPFFPIGIYAYACHPADGRFRPDHLQQAADAGYNLVLNTLEQRAGLDKELAAGIMGTLNITGALRRCTDSATTAKALSGTDGQPALIDHPCVAALWADDPENLENTEATPAPPTTVAMIARARRALRARAPHLPWVFAISNLPRLTPTMDYGDVLLSYRYAVPQYHPMMIYGYTIAVCRKTVPDKPMWFLSQALDLGYGAGFGLPEPMRPTPEEVRAMAFYSLVCGVRGYCVYANYINAEDRPEHWRTVLDIAQTMRHLAPLLAAGKASATVRLLPHSHAEAVFHREFALDGRHALIAVNMSGAAAPAAWQFPSPTKVAVLCEDRAVPEPARTIHDEFRPWAVHVYVW